MKDFKEFKNYLAESGKNTILRLNGSSFSTLSKIHEVTDNEIILQCRMFNKYIIVDKYNFEEWRTTNCEIIIGRLKYGEVAPQWKN